MPALQLILNDLAVPQADFARALGLSKATACRLIKHGQWPARAQQLHARVAAWLRQAGAGPQHWALARDAGLYATTSPFAALLQAPKSSKAPPGGTPGEACLSMPATPRADQPTETEMLLQLTT